MFVTLQTPPPTIDKQFSPFLAGLAKEMAVEPQGRPLAGVMGCSMESWRCQGAH